jgi:hypothetical protein
MSADNLAMPLIRGSSRLAAGSTPRRIIHTMRLLLVLVVLVVAGSGPVRTPTAYATEQSPAASYRLDATVDLDAGRVDTSEVVRYRNVVGVPLQSIVFRVVPNVVGTFSLRTATVDGQDISGNLDGSVLEFPLTSPLASGATTEISLSFSIAPPHTPGRLAVAPRGMALGNWFPIVAVYHGDWDRRQYVDTGDAFYTEVADYDLTVTTTTPAEVVATGKRADADGQRVHYVATNVRDLAVAISPDYVVRTATAGATTIVAAGTSRERSGVYLDRAAEFVRWLGDKLGPYPYPTLVVADIDLPPSYGGMEYPSLVMLAGRVPVPSPVEGSFFDALLLHEIAHQWFYSVVGNDEIDDPWLDEAFATYMIYAYYRDVRPDLAPGAYQAWIAGGGNGNVGASINDFPSDGPYINVVYRRGAQFLEGLQKQLGDAAFWALLRDHVATNHDRIATPRAFLDRAQAASTTSLNPQIAHYFAYRAFQPASPRQRHVDAPDSPWSSSVHLSVGSEFPIGRVEVWLDDRLLADGAATDLTLDLSDVEPGEYVLLVQATDPDGVLFERSRRVEVTVP